MDQATLHRLDSHAAPYQFDNDQQVARDILTVLSGVDQTVATLTGKEQRTAARVFGMRGIRDFIGAVWEDPRTPKGRAINARWSVGSGLWSPLARERTKTPVPPGVLVLEHVVPMKTVVAVLRAINSTTGDVRTATTALQQLIRRTVVLKEEDRLLTRNMSAVQQQVLIDHFTGAHVLSDDDLLEACWARYLEAPDALNFDQFSNMV